MTVKPALRITKLLIGSAWAQALLVAGYAVLFKSTIWLPNLAPALTLIAAGTFVAMWLVIDDLVPRAVPAVVVGIKLVTALMFWAGAGVVVYGLVTGSPIPSVGWPGV